MINSKAMLVFVYMILFYTAEFITVLWLVYKHMSSCIRTHKHQTDGSINSFVNMFVMNIAWPIKLKLKQFNVINEIFKESGHHI